MNNWTKRSRLLVVGCALGLLVAGQAAAHDGAGHAEAPAILSATAQVQLAAVQAATRKYRDLQAALDDGYVDIGVFFPNMGYHYLKPELLDGTFQPEAPELLVYSPDPCTQQMRLVAVEYAIPMALSRNAPAGFHGSADRWHANTAFGLWTLHAWVWMLNPDGVFAAFNTDVP